MKQDHSPWDEKTYQAGANTDVDGVVAARAPGVYRDARNMRSADPGNNTSLVKIGGEVSVVSADKPGHTTYKCIGAIEVKGRRITFWASTQPASYPPLIQVDGLTMVMSADLPYVWDRKLQLHKSEDCEGGMVFDASSGGVPLHWDIGKIMAAHAAGEDTYFSGMDITAYQVNPTRPVNRPVFTGLKQVLGGVKAGQYWYFIRYVNDNGDHTPDGPVMGPVMVPWTKDIAWSSGGSSDVFPGTDITGAGNPGTVGTDTVFGVGLRFRAHNLGGFERLEIVRVSYDLAAGPDAPPTIEVCHRQAVAPGENSVYDIVDKGDVLDPIASDDAAVLTYFIKEAKAVRYIGHRVAYLNVKLGSKSIAGTFASPQGARLVPFTKNLGREGHSDAVNHCYYRRFQSGERYGIGILYHDTVGGESFVQSVEDDVLMPSRRTPKTGQSLALSDAPCHAADINNNVVPTFEVFDHDNARGKQYASDVVNIMVHGSRSTSSNFAGQAATPTDPSWPAAGTGHSPDGIYLDDGPSHSEPAGWMKTAWLNPLRPVNPMDGKHHLDYRVNTGVRDTPLSGPAQDLGYDPKIHGVNHHTLGLGFTGLTSTPQGAQGFSMVATKPAGRVVTQGLFTWRIRGGSATPGGFATKDQSRGLLHLPDHAAGTLPQDVWDGLQQPGSPYRLQFVSPLGIASEQYGSAVAGTAATGIAQPTSSNLSDILSYARVLWDTGQVNPLPTGLVNALGGFSPTSPLPAVPSSGSPPDKFTGFGSWSNTPVAWPAADGDSLFTIQSANEVVQQADGVLGVVRSLEVQLTSNVYANGGPFQGTRNQARDLHEPWYVVNIVLDAEHPRTETGYVSCNHYQAFVSAIGVTEIQNQEFPLADEVLDNIEGRLVDGIERYIYLRSPQGVLRFMNREGMTQAQYTVALLTQASQGWFNSPFTNEVVEGVFEVLTDTDGNRYVKLSSYVPMDAVVEVRYDPRVPVKFYGDRTTSPALISMVDAVATANPTGTISSGQLANMTGRQASGTPAWPRFDPDNPALLPWLDVGGALWGGQNGLPVPFNDYRYNDRYMVPFGTVFGADLAVNQFNRGTITSIRQWKALFDLESTVPYHLSFYDRDGKKTFPNVNYVQRPYNYDPNGGVLASGVHAQYSDPSVYGGTEKGLWRFGGIKSAQEPMSDYVLVPAVRYFAKPKFGYQEREDQCNALIWSAKDSPLMQDSPGLKTFPVMNIEFLENDKGAGQRLFSSSPGNLFAIMEGQTLEILVNKSTAYSPDGTAFSLFAQDNFVGQVVPRSKFAGMPGDSWKTAAEGGAFAGGSQADALVWYDGHTAYMLAGSQVADIASGAFRKGLADAFDTTDPFISAVYDGRHNEFWLSLGHRVPVYLSAKDMAHWQGSYDYAFDDFLHSGGRMYGFRDLTTFELNNGPHISGQPVTAWVKVATAPANDRMEFRRVKVNSPRKPVRIEWYDEDDVLVAWMDQATFGPHYIKKETSGGWAHWVPRKHASVDPLKRRVQGTSAYYKVIYSDPGPDKIVTSGVQVKLLS